MEPPLEFVPREITLDGSPGCFMCLAPVCVQVTNEVVKCKDCIKPYLIYVCGFVL